MKISSQALFAFSALAVGVKADNFNYDRTNGVDYGPDEWNKVRCNNLETCVSSYIYPSFALVGKRTKEGSNYTCVDTTANPAVSSVHLNFVVISFTSRQNLSPI